MVADFFTKPLQGKQFYIVWDQVMNIDPSSKYHLAHRSVLSDGNKMHRNETSKTQDAIEVADEADGLGQLVEDDSRTNGVARMTFQEAAMWGGE